jgi:outer membrane protein TolC
VRGQLRLSLLDWTAAQRRADLLQHQFDLQQQILGLLEQRFQAGTVIRTDLTLARVALARTSVELSDAARQSAEARVRIADALGLTVKAIDGEKFDFPLSVSPEATEELTAAAVRQQALLGRPDILAALADYAASESALQLEIAKQYPDLHLSPGYQFDQGEHKWSLGLSAELPVLNQNKGPIAEANARREEVAAHFTVLQARVIGEIDRALASRAAAMDQLTNQIRLARLASDQAAAVQDMFEAGGADKLELSSAQLETAVTALTELDAQIKAQQAIAQLEEAIQRPVEGWPSLERGRSAQAKTP